MGVGGHNLQGVLRLLIIVRDCGMCGVQDLVGWDTLYVAGRLHKPVNILEMDPGNLQLGMVWISGFLNIRHLSGNLKRKCGADGS